MTTIESLAAVQFCEDFLREEIRYNQEHQILRNEVDIANQLLARGNELRDFYIEMFKKLPASHPQVRILLGAVLSVGAFWNPNELADERVARKRLNEVNETIANLSAQLARAVDRRNELHNTSAFYSETHYHVLNIIEASAENHHLFNGWVKGKLSALRREFGFKYWPSLSDFMSVIAVDAKNATAVATDPITAAGTSSTRGSNADFVRALNARVEEDKEGSSFPLPPNFRLSNNSIASLLNVVLDIESSGLVDGAYIKRIRQRDRRKNQQTEDGEIPDTQY
jgi:hypothetical protein